MLMINILRSRLPWMFGGRRFTILCNSFGVRWGSSGRKLMRFAYSSFQKIVDWISSRRAISKLVLFKWNGCQENFSPDGHFKDDLPKRTTRCLSAGVSSLKNFNFLCYSYNSMNIFEATCENWRKLTRDRIILKKNMRSWVSDSTKLNSFI